jgi:hypothetical protein
MNRAAAIAVILAGFWVSACAATTSTTAPTSGAATPLAPTSTAAAGTALPTAPPAVSETSITSEAPTLAATASATPEPSVATPAATRPPQHTPVPRPLPSVSLKPGQTPLPSPIDLSPFLTAQVSVLSLGDAALAVKVSFTDPDSGEGGEAAAFTLNTLDLDAEPVLPGVYVVTFTRASGSTKPVKCTLHVKDKDAFSFVATDQRIVVLKDGKLAKKTAEQTVQTSSLCAA